MLCLFLAFKKQKGFTLAEILIVIAIFGLLATIIFAVTRGAGEQGRIARGLYFSQHLQNSLGAHLVGRWSFDEGTGTTANDTSGWGNNGILVNGPTWRCASVDPNYTPSKQGCSLEFDGVNDYVNCGSGNGTLDQTDALTHEAWVKPSVSPPPSTGWITGKNWSDDNNRTPRIYFSTTGRFVGYFRVGGVHYGVDSNTIAVANNWYHVVWTYNKAQSASKIYINGVLERTTTVSVSLPTYPTMAFLIGTLNQVIQFFPGLIDEVRIYATALSTAQIQSNYYAGLERLLAKGQISQEEYQQRLANTYEPS